MARIGNTDFRPAQQKFQVKRLGEDSFRVTTPTMPEKSWTGETEQAAMWAAKKGVEKVYQEKEMTMVPKWILTEMERSSARESEFAGLPITEPTHE